jgi:hypothetical protein
MPKRHSFITTTVTAFANLLFLPLALPLGEFEVLSSAC